VSETRTAMRRSRRAPSLRIETKKADAVEVNGDHKTAFSIDSDGKFPGAYVQDILRTGALSPRLGCDANEITNCRFEELY
jgi:hypothetical protein